MRDFQHEALSHDPVHGYIPFTTETGAGEVAERAIIDHPWVQRLRQIHQLQTALWVFPSAEHSRFQHVMGVMHLGSRAVEKLYDSLAAVCPDVPGRPYVESLVRMAGLLHDIGHGPFGHFFDEHFLSAYGLTHETLGARIIVDELGDLLRGLRRSPQGRLRDDEQLDPDQVAYLITRSGSTGSDASRSDKTQAAPRWLALLRSLFSGLYTIDNMDFVLRDAYVVGYSSEAFDLDRLLHYSFFSEAGLTIHARGLPALVRFLAVRAELFRTVYFHRTVRALDLTLSDLFADSRAHLFPGNPLEHRDAYRRFTDWSLLVDAPRWASSDDPSRRALGERWSAFLRRDVRWKMAAERTVFFDPDKPETGSIFSRAEFFESALRDALPEPLRHMALRVDVPRHMHRPAAQGSAAGRNFLFDPARNDIRPLDDSELYRQLPLGYRLCRVYAETSDHNAALAAALDTLIGSGVIDDRTNM